MRRERGPIDVDALRAVERIVRNRLGELLTNVEYVPSAIDPTELRLELAVGFEANRCRFDVQWWTNHGYKYHYTEDRMQFRFGWELGTASPEKHFHPPENVTEHRESCITHEEPELVTLAVIKCWWTALQADDPSRLNARQDPP